MAIFPVNTSRFDPYKPYRFLVYFGTNTTPVAAVSKVSALKRSSEVIEYKEGGNAIILKGLGRTKYEPITLERGITQDTDFIVWADAAPAVSAATTHVAAKAVKTLCIAAPLVMVRSGPCRLVIYHPRALVHEPF